MIDQPRATVSFGPGELPDRFEPVELLDRFADRLARLERSITLFDQLLDTSPTADESVYQRFLEEHPLLLDIYGDVTVKPNFVYPEGTSPLGKKFVQPDFLIRRPGDRYRIIEIEKPSKPMATKAGQSRAEVGQAVFQIGEFKDFIAEHYDQLRDQYPGITRRCETVVVISRTRSEAFGGRTNLRRQLQLLHEQHSGLDELLTYDDLRERAAAALVRLSGMSINQSGTRNES